MREFSRRQFLHHSAKAAALIGAASTLSIAPASDIQKGILINHVGFAPKAAKFCVLTGIRPTAFQIVDRKTGAVVLKCTAVPVPCDFGSHLLGDFSPLESVGEFELRAPEATAVTFSISDNPYGDALAKSIRYFSKQRCGASSTGHHAPCHLDDGRRADNDKHHDCTGGWHDACDLRRWVDATIYGMIGLSSACENADRFGISRAEIVDELRWGESYFRKMQEPAGYLMNYCGGDDGNRYTDNQIGTADDRIIHVEPADITAQYLFVAAEAKLARLTRDSVPAFADGCIAAARKCLDWCQIKGEPSTATHFAANIIANCQMHLTSPDQRFENEAARAMNALLEFQLANSLGEFGRGAFRQSRGSDEPSREIHHGNLPPIAISAAIETFDPDAKKTAWREALRLHASYLVKLAQRSSFGNIPFGLYLNPKLARARPIGEGVGYRYFMRTRDEYSWSGDWWVGINAHLASCGIALLRAGRLLNEPAFLSAAQRQLDWILGANPFNASTMSEVGHGQPTIYVTTEFRPATPIIAGGVMNGIGGTADDTPTLARGNWNVSEYWTPMVAYTMQLIAELGQFSGEG